MQPIEWIRKPNSLPAKLADILPEIKAEIDGPAWFWKWSFPDLTGEGFEAFCYALWELVPAWWGETKTSELAFSYSEGFEEIPLHTDKSYWTVPPKYIAFQYVELTDIRWGSQTFYDIAAAFRKADEQTRYELSRQFPFKSPSNRLSKTDSFPIANAINGEHFFRIREDIIDFESSTISNFFSSISETEIEVETVSWDLIIANNWRMAHGRKKTYLSSKNSKRLMRRGLII